jgi:fatty acid desaturase
MKDVSAASVVPLRATPTDLSPAALHRRFVSAFRPRPWIYWADMLASAGLGWALFAWSVQTPTGSALHATATLGAIFALLRAALFIHELAHLKSGDLPYFEVAWNAVFGIPALTPSLMYVGSHMDHHLRTVFGTPADPEYVSMTRWGRLRIACFVLIGAIVPVLLALRWGIIAPLSRLLPWLRRVAVERMSTLVINVYYRRPIPRGRHLSRWAVLENAAMLFVWAVAAGVALGWIPLHLIGQLWLVSAGVWTTNQLRTLAAHGYHNEGEPVDDEGQLLDSINLDAWSPLTALVAPVGLRYHALHHHLPGLPYHSLGRVHRELKRELPSDSPYWRTLKGSLEETLTGMWHRASRSAKPDLLSGSRAARGL